jgi:hypothetical protein
MKILRPIGGAAGVFFPIGKVSENGTCENATKECLKFCCAKWGYDHDDEYRVSPKDKQEIYNAFIGRSYFDICDTILKEMEGLQTNILTWFVSGDCMKKDIPRLSKIIRMLSEHSDIYQNGFSKNADLFYKIQELERVHIVHTIDSKKSIGLGAAKIFAVCDYDHGITNLYTKECIYAGGCGPSEYKIKNLTIASNCKTCLRLKKGCFTVID